MEKKKGKNLIYIVIFIIIVFFVLYEDSSNTSNTFINNVKTNLTKNNLKTFKIISSQENKSFEPVILSYATQKGYDITFEYQGTLDIVNELNANSSNYDAVWMSNSIWNYMLDSKVKLSNSKCISINPVVFAIKKSKAESLGLIDKTVYTKDIVDAISSGNLKFSMSNPTSTNSGASAYLGLLATLAGNPEVLTKDILNNDELKQKLVTLFSGLERSSGSEEFLEELFLNGNYEAVVTYESSIININKQLVAKGEEPLYAIYPVDGVSISDSPFAYIDNKNDYSKEVFNDLQKYILSDEGQKLLEKQGKRTWYGGINSNADKDVFNPDWGIDTNKYISSVKFPSTDVIKMALNIYQTELKKPTHVVFCLDYSGSMYSKGITELRNAMQYILTNEAANDFIQFSSKDKIDIIPFSSEVGSPWSTLRGDKTESLLKNVMEYEVNGATAIYPAAIKALNLLKNEDMNAYNVSVVLMTDGQNNIGDYKDLQKEYKNLGKQIPIYSIMFGSADSSELETIASLTNGKVFDGKQSLVRAFKEVRGYN